jgi:hypothetical protein
MQHIVKINGLLAAFIVLSVIAQAQSIEPTRLEDCAAETERFLAERQDQIEREAMTLQDLPDAGVYHADDIGGVEWLLIWAPKTGFVAYYIPDAPCPARVTYGSVLWKEGVLTLTPKIPFHPGLKHIFGKRLRLIMYEKRRYLVLESRVKSFYKAQHWRGDPDLQPRFLVQRPNSDNFWRKDPLRPAAITDAAAEQALRADSP